MAGYRLRLLSAFPRLIKVYGVDILVGEVVAACEDELSNSEIGPIAIVVYTGVIFMIVGFSPVSSQVKPIPARRADPALLKKPRLPGPDGTGVEGNGVAVTARPSLTLHEPCTSTVEVIE